MKDIDGKTLKLKDQLTLIAVEESGTILDIERRCYYDLNDTAFFLARQLEEGCGYQSLTAELFSEFDVSEDAARSDIDMFVNELMKRDLVVIKEGEEGSVNILSRKPGLKPYQSPALECQRELNVAAANGALTTAN